MLPILIVGLGNPGAKYASQRHNVGFMAIDRLAARYGVAVDRPRNNALVGEGEVAGRRALLVKPQTFMNVSGEAVGPLLKRNGAPPADLLVVYDDLDLPLGKLRLREKGSAGGHNGMKSIIQAIGSDAFPRVRIGIGRPEAEGRTAIEHVLGRFLPDEQDTLDSVLDRAVQAIECFLEEGIQPAMNRYNG
jgi:PTH1 family peptidyl-tRNA hydrolase